jgi:hypothetical protein
MTHEFRVQRRAFVNGGIFTLKVAVGMGFLSFGVLAFLKRPSMDQLPLLLLVTAGGVTVAGLLNLLILAVLGAALHKFWRITLDERGVHRFRSGKCISLQWNQIVGMTIVRYGHTDRPTISLSASNGACIGISAMFDTARLLPLLTDMLQGRLSPTESRKFAFSEGTGALLSAIISALILCLAVEARIPPRIVGWFTGIVACTVAAFLLRKKPLSPGELRASGPERLIGALLLLLAGVLLVATIAL